MFGFLKNKLKKVYSQFTSKIQGLFSSNKIDEQTILELEKLLISADTGTKTTKSLIDSVKEKFNAGKIVQGSDLKIALQEKLNSLLETKEKTKKPSIYLLVGVNGSGKTTFAAKLANKFTKQQGKKVLLAAADTFRAAATEQLAQWASRTKTDIVIGTQQQDPGSVVFQACEKFKNENFDVLIIDTAGRLQTKTNLMKELEKIKRIIEKKLPTTNTATLLTVDSMLGQNSFEQAKLFDQSTSLDGIILTKMDGTGKGGIIFSLKQELKLPVWYISYGEKLDDFQEFDPQEYVAELLEK